MKKRFDPEPAELKPYEKGPLGAQVAGFAAYLTQTGYGRSSGWRKIRLMAALSCWLQRRRMQLRDLNEARMATFLSVHWKHQARRVGDIGTMKLLLRYLKQSGLVARTVPVGSNAAARLREEYEKFLLEERSLAPGSIQQYLAVAERFLSWHSKGGRLRLRKLRASDIEAFVLQDAADRGRRSTQLMATALRSLLGFLLEHGWTATNLVSAVPSVAGWRRSELPRYLEARDVEKVLRACDRRQKTGKRDYAILLLLARLGLRAGEVATLTLDDIDWRAGELLVHGKGSRLDKLPLPADVGEALVAYLKGGRPECATRRVFLQCRPPYVGFASPPNAVCAIVRAALNRAGVRSRHQGAHVLRHSLATRMLGRGTSLSQIGQVLRHQGAQTTEIYAKVDLKALRKLALPWMGGEQ